MVGGSTPDVGGSDSTLGFDGSDSTPSLRV